MARHGIVVLLAATILGFGVNAGPCKPYSSAALSSTITVESTATESATITADVTDTTDALETTVAATTEAADTTEVPETTVTESATETTGGLETTVIKATAAGTTDLVETTTTEVAIDTTGTLEPTTIETTAADTTNVDETTTIEAVVETSAVAVEPTTTGAAEPVCVPTQILDNTGFDDNNDGYPWRLDTGSTISQINPHSTPNFVYATVNQARTFTSIIQDLPALGDYTYHLQYTFNLQSVIGGDGFSCQVYPRVNGQSLASSLALTDSGPDGFQTGSSYFVPQNPDSPVSLSLAAQCLGSFNTIIIGIDDVTLTRTCIVSE